MIHYREENFLSVKNYDIGIVKEKQSKIFKRFEASSAFGVGLDIVSKLCKEHHIHITMDSEFKNWSEFKLYGQKTSLPGVLHNS
jgi:two-component system OmpR family sensor kinase